LSDEGIDSKGIARDSFADNVTAVVRILL